MRSAGVWSCLAIALGLSMTAALPAQAQTSAGLVGHVASTQGSPMADALVIITRTDIPGRYQVKTDENGRFAYYTLPVGTYEITVICPDGNRYPMRRPIRTSPTSLIEASFVFTTPANVAAAKTQAKPARGN